MSIIFPTSMQVFGLCGNFNGDINDDSMTPSGDQNKNVTQFVMEWQTNAECASVPSTSARGACSRSSQFEHYAEEICEALKEGMSKYNISLRIFTVLEEKSINQITFLVCVCL